MRFFPSYRVRLHLLATAMAALLLPTAVRAEPVDPNPMKMERMQLDNGRTIILQGGRAYAVNRVGVKRKIKVNAQFRAKDGSIITVRNGLADIQRPARSAKSPQRLPTPQLNGLTLEEAARRAGVQYQGQPNGSPRSAPR